MSGYDSYRVLTGRLQMFTRDWPGEGPPILFLHSITANSLLALRLGKLLGGKRRLLAPDLRGRGNTDMPFGEYGIPVHVRDVMAFMDRLHFEQFVLAGHSFGATLSVFIAAQYPERITGLILFDGGALPNSTAMMALDNYYRTLQYRYPSVEAYVERFKNAPTYQPWTDELEILVRSNLRQQPDGTFIRQVPRYVVEAEMRAENMATWSRLPDLYQKVRCPVLILRAGMGILGKDDQVLNDATIAQMVDGLTGATSVEVVTIEQAGHTSLMTIPSEIRDNAILRFLGIQPGGE